MLQSTPKLTSLTKQTNTEVICFGLIFIRFIIVNYLYLVKIIHDYLLILLKKVIALSCCFQLLLHNYSRCILTKFIICVKMNANVGSLQKG